MTGGKFHKAKPLNEDHKSILANMKHNVEEKLNEKFEVFDGIDV